MKHQLQEWKTTDATLEIILCASKLRGDVQANSLKYKLSNAIPIVKKWRGANYRCLAHLWRPAITLTVLLRQPMENAVCMCGLAYELFNVHNYQSLNVIDTVNKSINATALRNG